MQFMSITNRNQKVQVFSQFLTSIIFSIPIWIVYYRQYISIEQLSFLVSLQYIVQLVLELPTGAIADMIGRKKTIFLSYVLLAVSDLFIVFSANFSSLLVATITAGISEALLSGSLEALMYDSTKQENREKDFGKLLSVNSFWFQIGLGLGALTGGAIYQIDMRLPFLLHAGISVIAAISCFWFIEPKLDSEKFTFKNYFKQIRDGFREAFRSRATALISIYYIIVGGLTWPNQIYFKSYILVDLGFNEMERSLIDGGLRFFNVFALTALLRNDHLFTKSRSIYFFPIVMTICFLPGLWFNGWSAIPFIVGATMAGTARWIILSPLTNEHFSSKFRATAISALSMSIGVIYIIITSVSGPIIANFGGVRMMYTILGVLTLIFVLPLSIIVAKEELKKSINVSVA